MDVREPALPVDPRLPGEPTLAEVTVARMWLGRRGVVVWLPTRVLALRLGARDGRTRGLPVHAIVLPMLGWFGWVWLESLELPGRVAFPIVLHAVYQVVRWRQAQGREQVAEWWAGTSPPALSTAAKLVGGWYLASTAVTFVGGAALCAAAFTTESSIAVAAHTLALAAGAGATALVLGRVLRAPVIAEDAASHLVDGLLRAEDAYRFASPAPYVLVVASLPVVDWLEPGPLEWFALAYLVVVLGLQLTGWLLVRRRYRWLPPGFYGR
ncbi:hypothetical protein ABZ342_33990 [Amycolatopsis sp. NPDC005961]|uniref:hypothetical protein n=1 Tax=Amycolatopsis sp. NPDC005961 TaxID=3156720 RepID=UPI00340479D0